MASASKAVGEAGNLILMIVMYGLVVGSILGATVFTTLTIINTTYLSEQFGAFTVAIIGFLGTIGTIIAVVWLIRYVKELFDKKQGLGNMTA